MSEWKTKASAERVLQMCRQRGLIVREMGALASYPNSRHWHISKSNQRGTLELTESSGKVWLKVAANRDGGWASELAEEIAAKA